MPSSQRSLQLTDRYRQKLITLADSVEAQAREFWPRIEELDHTTWPEQMAPVVSRAQVSAVRLSAAYLSAFIASETGQRARLRPIDSKPYVGVTRSGAPLTDALVSPLIGTRAALKDKGPGDALKVGLARGVRMTKFETVQTGREALLDAIATDDRITGHQRAVAGTCAACMALSGTSAPHFEVHPNCECVPLPVVKDAPDNFPLPTGNALFAALSAAAQVAAVGAEAAELIASGAAALKDFVSHSPQSEQDDFLTQRPVQDVAT